MSQSMSRATSQAVGQPASQAWRRIERRDASGAVVDWVEVGSCAGCGRGVDREFPREYRAVGGVLFCRECAGRAGPQAGPVDPPVSPGSGPRPPEGSPGRP
jgi:hypothetical protein